MLKELVLRNRSYRRFDENAAVSEETLRELVDLARTVPSTANSQALKFALITEEKDREKVYENLGWAAALKDWDGPEKGERPAAYILVLCDQSIAKNKPIDDGIVSQTIMLGACEKGLGGCIFGNIRRKELSEALGIDMEKFSIDLVIAIGKPIETIVLTEIGEDGSTTYYRDKEQVHYVPKRTLEELIVKLS